MMKNRNIFWKAAFVVGDLIPEPRPSRTADEDPLADAGWWSLFLFRRIDLLESLCEVRLKVPRVTSTASTSFYWAVQHRVRMLQLKAPARNRLRILLLDLVLQTENEAILSHPFS